jgi:hypothetical protein
VDGSVVDLRLAGARGRQDPLDRVGVLGKDAEPSGLGLVSVAAQVYPERVAQLVAVLRE